jgi:asparagine N-glycosylation enzyme membrane subunit Stt3
MLRLKIIQKLNCCLLIIPIIRFRKFSVDTATADESDTDRIFNSVEEGISSRKVRYVYTTIGAEIKHKFNISENIQLVPLVNYHFSYPYNRDEPREEVYTQRFKSMLYAILYANKTELILGGEYFGDYSVN